MERWSFWRGVHCIEVVAVALESRSREVVAVKRGLTFCGEVAVADRWSL